MKLTKIFSMILVIGAFSVVTSACAQEKLPPPEAGQALADAARDLLPKTNKQEAPKEYSYTLKELDYYKKINIHQALTHIMLDDKKIVLELLNDETQKAFKDGYSSYQLCVGYVRGEIAEDKRMMAFYKKMTPTEPPKIDTDLGRRSSNCLALFIPQKPQII